MVMFRHRATGAACALVVVVVAPFARAEPFGHEGQAALDDLLGMRAGSGSGAGAFGGSTYTGLVGYAHARADNPMSSASMDAVWFAPSADLFLEHGISVGAKLTFEYDRVATSGGGVAAQSSSSFSIGVTPRIGYAIPLSASVALWPRVFGGYARESMRMGTLGAELSHSDTWNVGAELGIVFLAGEHLYFDLAPEVIYRTSSSELDQGRSSSFNAAAHARMGLLF
jgi:hypothetical protein